MPDDQQPEPEPEPFEGIVSTTIAADYFAAEARDLKADLLRAMEQAIRCTCFDRTCDYCREQARRTFLRISTT